MLLVTNSERLERNNEKILSLLNFLKEETYSDFQTLMLLFGFKSHKSLYSLLAKVTSMGLIQKHTLNSRTNKIALCAETRRYSDALPVRGVPHHRLVTGSPS